jgi:hypothetical protein
MSTWMSIGFDPDQMDPVTKQQTQPAIAAAQDDSAPRQTGGLDHATPSEFGAVSGLSHSGTHGIAGAIKRVVARHRTLRVPEWRL